MLTVVKVMSNKSGYEAEYNFCLVRDGEKYIPGELYVCKVLSRFCDNKGYDHFVVVPISNEAVKDINYDLAVKVYKGDRAGILHLLGKGCPQELQELYNRAVADSHYDIDSAEEYEKDMYLNIVQEYLSSLVQ